MIVTSTRFGTIDVPEETAFDLGPGLLGFPEGRRYIVIEIEDDDVYFWLQSVEIPELAFLAIRPWEFFPDYELDVPEMTQTEIELDDPVDSEVFVLLTTQHEGDELVDITANLLGPVVVNTTNRKGRQLVLSSDEYGTREPLVSP